MRQLIRLARLPGRILLSLHTGNLARSTGMKFKKKKVDINCGCLVNSCNFTNEANSYTPKVEMHTRQKLGKNCPDYPGPAGVFIEECSSRLLISRLQKPRSR